MVAVVAAAVVAGLVVAARARAAAVVTHNRRAKLRLAQLYIAMRLRVGQLRKCRVKSASIDVTREIKLRGPPARPGAPILTSFCNARSRRRAS